MYKGYNTITQRQRYGPIALRTIMFMHVLYLFAI